MDSQAPSRFPVSQKKFSLDIKGNKTDIVLCGYDDTFMVMVTQIGSMGTILQARQEQNVSMDPTFSVSVIFGKRDERVIKTFVKIAFAQPLLIACGRQLIEHISSSGSSRPLMLSLGLKDHSVESLKEITSAVIENRIW